MLTSAYIQNPLLITLLRAIDALKLSKPRYRNNYCGQTLFTSYSNRKLLLVGIFAVTPECEPGP